MVREHCTVMTGQRDTREAARNHANAAPMHDRTPDSFYALLECRVFLVSRLFFVSEEKATSAFSVSSPTYVMVFLEKLRRLFQFHVQPVSIQDDKLPVRRRRILTLTLQPQGSYGSLSVHCSNAGRAKAAACS